VPPAAAKKPVSPAARPPAPVPAAASRPAPAAAAATAQDPLKPWKDREARSKFREEQLQGLRDRIGALQSRLDYLNLKRLAILDPLRVMPKAQSEDERTADAGKGSRDLLASVDEEINSAEADLKEAKDDLVTIETRFAQESAQP
jgi:cell division protein ZapA (FtsZ GTPase activity inhibitor)